MSLYLMIVGWMLCLCQVAGATPSRYDHMLSLYQSYNQRFDSQGRYDRNEKMARDFISQQEGLVNTFRQQGAFKEVLFIENSYDKELWVRLSVVQDENQQVIGFYWDQGKYQDTEERSLLRFRTRTAEFQIQGIEIKVEASGLLRMKYLENISQKRFSEVLLQLKQSSDHGWELYYDNKPVKKAWVEVWTRIFPPNGGIKKVHFL